MKPYYEHGKITIYHEDARDWMLEARQEQFGVLMFDPPFGISYRGQSGLKERTLDRSIVGDEDTTLRDDVIEWWGGRPALVFGTWKIQRPAGTKARLIWDTKGANGMGDLSIPWKPSDQEIYVLGAGFRGRRDSNVLRYAPVQSSAKNGRLHPHQKPRDLLVALLKKCPDGEVVDPCMGVGSTLVAAQLVGKRATGVEVDERYCEIAARRLLQDPLPYEM